MASAFPISYGAAASRTIDAGWVRLVDMRFAGGLRLARHDHERPTMALVVEGAMESHSGRRADLVAPGSLLVEPSGSRHANRFSPSGARVVAVQPDPHDARFHLLADSFRAPRSLRLPAHALVGLRIARELAQPDDLTPLALESAALDLLAAAGRASGRAPRPDVDRVTEYLRSATCRGLRVADVASVVAVSPAVLARAFRAHHGCSIPDFVRRLRVLRAAERLAIDDESIASIALDTGFSDQSHLTRWFTRLMGVGPAAYRRDVRGDRRH